MKPVTRAAAKIEGSKEYPDVKGTVKITDVFCGVRVEVEIFGLPRFCREDGKIIGPFGFQINQEDGVGGGGGGKAAYAAKNYSIAFCGGAGGGDGTDGRFKSFNPDGAEYGNEAGRFPPLISHDGKIFMSFVSGRFSVYDAIGLPVVILERPDDFIAPAPPAKRIACGVLLPVYNPS